MDQKRVIRLKDLWDIFVHRLWAIILVAAICVGAVFAYNTLTFVPEYESTATLYILRENTGETGGTSSDFSLALAVVNDCTYLLKSHAVVDQVIAELKLNTRYSTLRDSISTSNPENTRILEVTVVAETPELAKQIVDKICEIGANKIQAAMGFNQVNLYEYGILEKSPCNQTGMFTYILIGMVVAVLAYGVFLIAFLADDRIRTEEDIEQYLQLSILGDIPNADDTKKHKYGYYTAYGKKGK